MYLKIPLHGTDGRANGLTMYCHQIKIGLKRKKVKSGGLEKTVFLSTWIQLLSKDPKSWDTIYIEGKNPEPVN